LINSETFPTRIEMDRRATQVQNGTLTGWFRTISRARRSAEFAASRFKALANSATDPGQSEMLSLAGFTYLWFAENFCSGVPFSTANPDGSLVFGQPLTRQQVFDTAAARFQAALDAANALTATAAGRSNVINLASIGLSRARLNNANFVGAAAAVAGVPTTYTYSISHSQTTVREENGVFNAFFAGRYSLGDAAAATLEPHALPWRASSDIRLPHRRALTNKGAPAFGFDNTTAQFLQLRYPDRKTAIPLATGAEARLIEAEVALMAGDTATFRARHDSLRAKPPTYFNSPDLSVAQMTPMPPLNIAGLPVDSVITLHFRERAFWLWLTAHRLGDLRRLSRPPYSSAPFNFVADSVFPNGKYFKGGTYGTDYSFPVPFDETNNPNFSQCLDRLP
jgi:hypothetical protein